ncbi:MAG: hypothetical protein ACK5DG_15020 [Chitinophagaceae bacterium]|jgi:hypothetical protein
MKQTLFIFFLISACSCFSQETAITKDGRKVLLHDDGTWKYVQDVNGVKMPDSTLKKFSKAATAKTLLTSKRTNHALWYDAAKWNLTDLKISDASEYLLKLKNEDAYCITVVERLQIPLESFKDIVIKSLKMRGIENIEILDEEYRIVNNIRVLYLKFSAANDGVIFTYCGYYFSNESGTSQILCYTSPNLLKQYKPEFDKLLNGFVIQEDKPKE